MKHSLTFVGIGQMGGGMAQRLIASGFDVMGFDVSEKSRATAQACGINVQSKLESALRGRQIILSSVPNAQTAREAWLGPEGILAYAQPGTIGIELSTIDPETMRDLASAAKAKGVKMIDAPVSGGPAEAANGTLVLMVGGKPEDIAQVDDVLKALSSAYHYTGAVGTGKTVKLVNNMMSMGNILIAAEAFALGTAAGVDAELLFSVLSGSGGRSHHFLKRFPNAIKGNFAPGFKLELGEKDLALAIEFARTVNHPTPAASAVRELMAMGLAAGYRGQDVVAMLDYYNKMHQE
jgi:3-hydroxyisobutyrate dehydrogenase